VNHPDATLSALADPARRRVVELLADGPRRASDIAEHIGMTRAATSRHLKTLRETGLLEVAFSSVDARERNYSLRVDQLSSLNEWLEQVEARWHRQLRSFAEHVERSR